MKKKPPGEIKEVYSVRIKKTYADFLKIQFGSIQKWIDLKIKESFGKLEKGGENNERIQNSGTPQSKD